MVNSLRRSYPLPGLCESETVRLRIEIADQMDGGITGYDADDRVAGAEQHTA